MARRAQRATRVPSIRDRKFRRPDRKGGPNWPLIAVGAAVVVVVVVIVTLLLIYRQQEATPTDTPPVTDEPIGETPGGTALAEPANTPTATSPPPTPTPTATATPIPRPCQVLESTWVRAEPKEQSTGIAQITPDDEVSVIGEVQDDEGKMWYQVVGYSGEAYVEAEKVECQGP